MVLKKFVSYVGCLPGICQISIYRSIRSEGGEKERKSVYLSICPSVRLSVCLAGWLAPLASGTPLLLSPAGATTPQLLFFLRGFKNARFKNVSRNDVRIAAFVVPQLFASARLSTPSRPSRPSRNVKRRRVLTTHTPQCSEEGAEHTSYVGAVEQAFSHERLIHQDV
jgi:hypothetical protein